MTKSNIFADHYRPLNPEDIAASETNFKINFVGLILGLFFLLIFRSFEISVAWKFTGLTVLVAVSVTLMEYLCYGKNSPLGLLKVYRKINFKRCCYKILGLFFVFGCIACIYWLFPLFHEGTFKKWIEYLKMMCPYLGGISICYIFLMDIILKQEKDEYWHIGYYLIHRKNGLSYAQLANLARSWLVKLFFLGLMVPWSFGHLSNIEKEDFFSFSLSNPVALFFALETICYGIDVIYGAIGYIGGLKVNNTHIRSAEPTLFGWIVAIMCYWPFWGVLFYPHFLDYHHTNRWMDIFDTGGVVWYAWAAMIVVCELIYAMSTVAAGTRFSNLTYRGLWHTGPYRWTKHPAYIAKNISWWLITMPFMLETIDLAIKCSLLLFCVNIIYYLRAKTEERHLSHYSEYREYALLMNDKSIFRFITRFFPFLEYRIPMDK
ncbi:MAG: hypothetical protein IKV03_03745 [Alphaproteobacteria bacterium]|nr:hypothetical protein [Alphaproteobacteria bacterium]